MNVINYRKTIIRLVYSSKKAHENCNYPEYVFCLQKEGQTCQKSKFNLLFFRVEASKVNEFFKNIRLLQDCYKIC